MKGEIFQHDRYMIRRKVFKLFGDEFHIYEPSGQIAFYAKMKAFKLKEDITLYASEAMDTPALSIRARQVIDFSATYDVVDPATGERAGALGRKGLSSLMRDKWVIMSADETPIGEVVEDSMLMAMMRRFASNLIPQNFSVALYGQEVADFKRRFNPFILKMDLDFSKDAERKLDRRLGIAAAVLLSAIEGRQD